MIIRRLRWMFPWLVMTAMATGTFAAQGKKDSKTPDSTAQAQSVPSIPAGPTYVIGPGDLLDIDVWRNAELSFKGLPVRPDGMISIPLLNDVQAAGLTAMQLSRELTEKLKSYVKTPQVTVVVSQVNSQRYYILGEVAHPGVFPLLPDLTALQAISSAGGFTQFANEKKIYILRGAKKFPFNYKVVVQGKDLQQNIELKPGDTVVIP